MPVTQKQYGAPNAYRAKRMAELIEFMHAAEKSDEIIESMIAMVSTVSATWFSYKAAIARSEGLRVPSPEESLDDAVGLTQSILDLISRHT
jgi:hypothetical protein